jgi:hypothetical protein
MVLFGALAAAFAMESAGKRFKFLAVTVACSGSSDCVAALCGSLKLCAAAQRRRAAAIQVTRPF